MNEHDPLESMLREHLTNELAPELGKSRESFQRAVAEYPRTSARWKQWGVAVGAIAAGLLLAWMLRLNHQQQGPVIAHLPMELNNPTIAHLATEPASAVASERVSESVVWQTIDEGTRVLDGKYPVRQLRQQLVQKVEWFDSQQQAWIEYTVPRERVVYVALNTN